MSSLVISLILLLTVLFTGALVCEALLYSGEQQLKSWIKIFNRLLAKINEKSKNKLLIIPPSQQRFSLCPKLNLSLLEIMQEVLCSWLYLRDVSSTKQINLNKLINLISQDKSNFIGVFIFSLFLPHSVSVLWRCLFLSLNYRSNIISVFK